MSQPDADDIRRMALTLHDHAADADLGEALAGEAIRLKATAQAVAAGLDWASDPFAFSRTLAQLKRQDLK